MLAYLLHGNPMASLRRNLEPLTRLLDRFLFGGGLYRAEMLGALADNIDALALGAISRPWLTGADLSHTIPRSDRRILTLEEHRPCQVVAFHARIHRPAEFPHPCCGCDFHFPHRGRPDIRP